MTLHAVAREFGATKDKDDRNVYGNMVELTQSKMLNVISDFEKKDIRVVKVVCGYQNAAFLACK
jgi:hypothetical protein